MSILEELGGQMTEDEAIKLAQKEIAEKVFQQDAEMTTDQGVDTSGGRRYSPLWDKSFAPGDDFVGKGFTTTEDRELGSGDFAKGKYIDEYEEMDVARINPFAGAKFRDVYPRGKAIPETPLNRKTEVTKYFADQFGGDRKMAEAAYKSYFGQPTSGIGSIPSKLISPLSKFASNLQGMPIYNKDGTPNLQNMADYYSATQRNLERQRLDKAREKDPIIAQTPIDPCPAGYRFDSGTQSCVKIGEEDTTVAGGVYERNPESIQDYLNRFRPEGMTGDVPLEMYGRLGGEYKWFAANGGSTNNPRGNVGEVTGQGGPKDDLVGPFMLSNKEYVLPNEQIKMYGGGNYETGVKRLERDRLKSLGNFS